MGQYANGPTPALYPPGQGIFHAAGSTDIEPIGDPNQQTVVGPPIQLTAPDISKLIQQEGQKQGLNSSQITALTKAFSSFGGGGGYGGAGGAADWSSNIGQGTGGYQGGISEVGYPPGIAPNATFSYEEGGWTARLTRGGRVRATPVGAVTWGNSVPNGLTPMILDSTPVPAGFGQAEARLPAAAIRRSTVL